MNDVAEIVALTHAYCWALDSHSWDALDEVFTPDATAELGRHCAGREAIKVRISTALEPLKASQHMVSTHRVWVDGDRATCSCYLQAQHIGNRGGIQTQYLVGGRYDDELERTVDGWRITSRSAAIIWTVGDPTVLQP
jgi:hypothetical protein